MTAEQTFWNAEPCAARRVTVIVADNGEFPLYWARGYVGQRRDAVEVQYGDDVFYIDDGEHVYREQGDGWAKVTTGRGSPRWGHGSLVIAPGSVEPRS